MQVTSSKSPPSPTGFNSALRAGLLPITFAVFLQHGRGVTMHTGIAVSRSEKSRLRLILPAEFANRGSPPWPE
jgi:hypothetical protein